MGGGGGVLSCVSRQGEDKISLSPSCLLLPGSALTPHSVILAAAAAAAVLPEAGDESQQISKVSF